MQYLFQEIIWRLILLLFYVFLNKKCEKISKSGWLISNSFINFFRLLYVNYVFYFQQSTPILRKCVNIRNSFFDSIFTNSQLWIKEIFYVYCIPHSTIRSLNVSIECSEGSIGTFLGLKKCPGFLTVPSNVL